MTVNLIDLLSANSSILVTSACEALAAVGDTRAVAPLIRVLASQNPELRKAASLALGQLRDSAAIDPLIRSMQARNAYAARALANFQDEASHQALVEGLKAPHSAIRLHSAIALAERGHMSAVLPLKEALAQERDQVTRANITGALARLGNEESFQSLLQMLSSSAAPAKADVVFHLGFTQDKRALQPLYQYRRSMFAQELPQPSESHDEEREPIVLYADAAADAQAAVEDVDRAIYRLLNLPTEPD